MASSNLIKQLQERGLVAQVTDEEALAERLAQGPIALYCGFDPTADSLHLGHLVPLLCLKRFQQAGHKPVALVGGATGLIGDPSFKAAERKLNTEDTVQEWVDKIRKQVAPFLDFDCGDNSAIAANNYDWFGSMNVLTFLRDIVKHFSVNQMINKEAVKQRLNRDDQGISFTEFSYNLLQGYDFACLNKLHGVALQIGGSDQWGNITSGIDLTRRLHQNQVFGLTVPLITKADGTKFGKTEGGAVWLDPKKTSPYKFYQFWINTADADVYRFLKFFTFMDIEEINALEEEDKNSGKAPRAQYVLAEQVTRLVHGEEGLVAAKRITESLFNGNLSDLSEADFEQLAQDGVPMIEMDKGADLMQALVDSELQPSRGQARKTIASNAVTINGEKQSDPEYFFTTGEAHQLGARVFALRNVLVPLHAVREDSRYVTQGFDVVYAGRLTPCARACRERRLRAWVSTATFEGVDQRGFFTADVTPCPSVDKQFKVETGAHNVFAKQTGFGRFGDCATQMHGCFDIFTAQEDITTVRFQRKRGNQHAFHQQVRQLFHQQTVFIGARLHFIGVTQQVTDVHGFVFRHQAPLQTGGKARAAAPFQASVFYLINDFIR